MRFFTMSVNKSKRNYLHNYVYFKVSMHVNRLRIRRKYNSIWGKIRATKFYILRFDWLSTFYCKQKLYTIYYDYHNSMHNLSCKQSDRIQQNRHIIHEFRDRSKMFCKTVLIVHSNIFISCTKICVLINIIK